MSQAEKTPFELFEQVLAESSSTRMLQPSALDKAQLLGLLELMAGVCEKAQWLIDSNPEADIHVGALCEALEACDNIPPIDDANERDGWLVVYDRIRGMLQ